jgi:hypothetical protein
MNDHGNLYSDHGQRLNTILGASLGDHGWLWPKIRVAKMDYISETNIHNNSDFFDSIEQDYGIKVHRSEYGLNLKLDIVDEAKLLLFLLRY